ncbi:MAG: Fe-S cluster assembly protein IscX [Ignavibacteria bacterium]|nr:Fe-S cluster assembly protein IscX [Ignavibacteria bacterium]
MGKTTKWTWRDVDDIALDLIEQHPNTDPLTVQLEQLHKMVTELPTFGDDPHAATQTILEAIQAAWYDEFED